MFSCLCHLQMVRGEVLWAGAASCALCISMPGMCQESINALCQQIYTKILKNSLDVSPSVFPDFHFSSSYGERLDCTSHLQHGSSLCWQHTLKIKEHEFWRQSLVHATYQLWLLGKLLHYSCPLFLISKIQI